MNAEAASQSSINSDESAESIYEARKKKRLARPLILSVRHTKYCKH